MKSSQKARRGIDAISDLAPPTRYATADATLLTQPVATLGILKLEPLCLDSLTGATTILLRTRILRCALRTRFSALGAMTCPDVFRSSPPPPGTRRERLMIRSSSPDLPPLQDILSQKSTRPPLRSGSKAAPIPHDAPRSFISARTLAHLAETAPEAPQAAKPNEPVVEGSCDADASVSIIEIPPEPQPKPRKPRTQKARVKKADGPGKTIDESKPAKKERTRKKPQPKAKKNEQEDSNARIESKAGSSKEGGSGSTGTTSRHFESIAEPDPPTKVKESNTNGPLELELATARKVDWTPPAQKTIINLDSDCSTVKQPALEGGRQQSPTFRNLIEGYACLEKAPQITSAPIDEDSGFLKKRKRIELVTDTNQPKPEVPEKSPTKKKAPRKKPRTITEIATAAYKTPTQPDAASLSAPTANDFPSNDADPAVSTIEPAKKGKSKPSTRKRPSRATKKKAPPPKPILLSPGAALDQVAKQNFLFGTSSQLAREPSPTVLRDLQAAIRRSNQDDFDDFATPINSDVIEPPEQRPKLWGAAARDAEGDLFDVEVINLTESSPQLPTANAITDPFGYFRSEGQSAARPAATEVIAFETTDSFVNLSDTLPAACEVPVQVEDDDSPFFSRGDISVSTNIQGQASPRNDLKASAGQPSGSQREIDPLDQPSRPKYELLNDIQLAKEVKTYGFKPIKRRSAMISLLDQCWQSKIRIGHAGIHTSATLSTAASKSTRSNVSAPAASPVKRPRGRPRKNSVSASEPQEPPPSAQPPDTPKRPRGRPRKDSASPLPVAKSRPKPKTNSPKKSAASPRRKKSDVKAVIEIPDSASDNEIDFASSPNSSIEQMFSSPPPLDLSLSMADDTELSLTASQSDQQKTLFDHITQAIKSTPRTLDPLNPSWHEKILLYDPIVLEDLAAWLNAGELTQAGYDGEISPGEVKKWCESKSCNYRHDFIDFIPLAYLPRHNDADGVIFLPISPS
ncbi:hypothetical protein G7Z17_g3416 [Cylindrodendrum hubeiense]|uniref:Structure-specific endonuclease subunit SLX4 n=1 Tax=Cylindrodendrum hubeiense TaxID=595255 RepID=A0A9P5HGZ0_9HYPO|nr:hypothetical protein G7Z17_g3416 [Cylindrodendrum hubeiense]